MQSPLWYYNRLRAMSRAEIAWRISSEVNDLLDLVKVARGWCPVPTDHGTATTGGTFEICEVSPACWADTSDPQELAWLARLTTQAESVLNHQLTFFDLENHPMGDPVAWHTDQNTGVTPALRPIYFVDYRQADTFGDCRLVWEPNRHHQLVVLGRAWRATGDERYAQAVVSTIDSWLAANPYGYGMNWRSPLELAIRVINWVFALDLIRESAALTPDAFNRIRRSAYQHCYDISRKYSQGSSANNHLIGEAAGAYVASCWFGFDQQWIDQAQSVLEEQARLQSFPDGGSREQATGYQYFVLQFMFAAIRTAQASGRSFSRRYLTINKEMSDFLLALCEAGPQPYVGDYDDGYLLDLGKDDERAYVVLAMRAALDTSGLIEPCEAAFWLGVLARRNVTRDAGLQSHAFRDSGYYLLQGGPDDASLLFDCGNLGFTQIAAHGHADALAVVFRLRGDPILIDPGTYDYFTYPVWRNHFRSTSAHNTLEVDGQDQSVMSGAFLWGLHAEARCRSWDPGTDGKSAATGVHHGYERLEDPVTHERQVELDADARRLDITDRLTCASQHTGRLFFHFDATCSVEQIAPDTLEVRSPHAQLRMSFAGVTEVALLRGSESPRAGWQSRRYHHLEPTVTAIATFSVDGTTEVSSSMSWLP